MVPMGLVYRFGCADCGFEQEIRQGTVIMVRRPDNLLRMLLDEERETVQDLVEEKSEVKSFQFSLYFCPPAGYRVPT